MCPEPVEGHSRASTGSARITGPGPSRRKSDSAPAILYAPTMKLPSRTARRGGERRTSDGADQPPWGPDGSHLCGARRVFEALRPERVPNTTTHSQPDPQCDRQPIPLRRPATPLAAHRQVAEGRREGASRRGRGQGARQSLRASATRTSTRPTSSLSNSRAIGMRPATAGPGSFPSSTPASPTASRQCAPFGRWTSRCSARSTR